MDVKALRLALAAKLEVIPDLLQVSAYMLAQPSPPAAHIIPGPIDWHRALQDGMSSMDFVVQVFVPTTTDQGSQELLDLMLATTGEHSVKAAIEKKDPGQNRRNLGGACSDLLVTTTTGYRQYKGANGAEMLGADWNVTVYGR